MHWRLGAAWWKPAPRSSGWRTPCGRICIAYGFTDCEIYAVTSLIVATIRDKDGNHYTQSVRVQSYGTDLGRLEELNAFSRRICAQVPDVEDLTRADSPIQKRQAQTGDQVPGLYAGCRRFLRLLRRAICGTAGRSRHCHCDLPDGLSFEAAADPQCDLHLCGRVRLRGCWRWGSPAWA